MTREPTRADTMYNTILGFLDNQLSQNHSQHHTYRRWIVAILIAYGIALTISILIPPISASVIVILMGICFIANVIVFYLLTGNEECEQSLRYLRNLATDISTSEEALAKLYFIIEVNTHFTEHLLSKEVLDYVIDDWRS